ncbi:hypothetical protein ACIQPP_16670 [Streptomyces violaceusniger]|uniref:hypothetical protein n=1 Tax=Streptomyces violaceusniger TaxID=68280 RepID=UPI000998597C|nr:hypothetical protein [Streptomyces hygroscopicus]
MSRTVGDSIADGRNSFGGGPAASTSAAFPSATRPVTHRAVRAVRDAPHQEIADRAAELLPE